MRKTFDRTGGLLVRYRRLSVVILFLALSPVSACAPVSQAPTRSAPAAVGDTTRTVNASVPGLSARLELPAGELLSKRDYPVVFTLTNEGTRTASIYGYGDLTASDASGTVVYDWYVASGRARMRIAAAAIRKFAPGGSFSEQMQLTLPHPGVFTVTGRHEFGGWGKGSHALSVETTVLAH
jgi:hypothetical protein